MGGDPITTYIHWDDPPSRKTPWIYTLPTLQLGDPLIHSGGWIQPGPLGRHPPAASTPADVCEGAPPSGISSEDMARIHATIMYFGNFWDMLGELSLLTTVNSYKMRGFLENHRLRFQPFLPPLDEPQESNEFPVNQNRMSRRRIQNWSK